MSDEILRVSELKKLLEQLPDDMEVFCVGPDLEPCPIFNLDLFSVQELVQQNRFLENGHPIGSSLVLASVETDNIVKGTDKKVLYIDLS
jgi:hypothetical protein